MNVALGRSNVYSIESVDLRKRIFATVEKILGVKIAKHDTFPGPQPVAVEKKDFGTLIKNQYMVCEKTDGERHVLILIKLDSKPMAFLLSRNGSIYFLNISCKKEVWEGSIFDGELVQTKKDEWHYLIHDCMAYNSRSFMEHPHHLRYACIMDFITKRYTPKESDAFDIKTKLFYVYGDRLAETWQHIVKTTENKIDGLILTPVRHPIIFGRDFSLFKWKNPEDHTMDFLVKLVQKKYNLYYYRKSQNVIYKTFGHRDANYPVIKTFVESNSLDVVKGVIIEFKYSMETEVFKPYRIRLDKDKPNGELTIQNTFKNIEESIEIDDFKFTPDGDGSSGLCDAFSEQLSLQTCDA
jgi:hypothetical protein